MTAIKDYDTRFNAYTERLAAITAGMDDWHSRRFNGIGGSEIASLLGLNKYQTPHELWEVKTGRRTPFAGNDYTHWGTILEETVAQEFARLTGEKIRKTSKHYKHKEFPWLIGNLDRLIEKNSRHGTKILECKTCTDDSALDDDGLKEWGSGNTYNPVTKEVLQEDDTVPVNYLLQVQHYMNITGIDTVDLAVLFMRTRNFRIYTIHRNDQIIHTEIEESRVFWESVLDDKEPPLTPEERLAAVGLIKDLKEDYIPMDSEINFAIQRYKTIRAEREKLEAEEKEITDTFKLLIGDRLGIADGKKILVSYGKPSERATIDSKRLKAEMPDIYDRFVKVTNVSRILKIK